MINYDDYFIILISYRSREDQPFRREELIICIDNIKTYFEQNKIKYKIVIAEQYNDKKFNRGLLLNIAFLESENKFNFSKKYMHMNADYRINLSKEFPLEFLNFKKGFLDISSGDDRFLGGACIFDAESYRIINGFPNDLEGWGCDDWAIFNRIKNNNIQRIFVENTLRTGFIIEENNYIRDQNNHFKNCELAQRNDSDTNGLTSINYNLEGYGEFHDENIIFHLLVN